MEDMTMNRNLQLEQALRSHSGRSLGHVNPPISDSAMFSFESGTEMTEMFENGIPGRFLYGRHSNPSNQELANALAFMENAEAALVTASGLGAISSLMVHLCQAGDEIIASHTIYGGTYALFANLFPKFGLCVKFVDFSNLESVQAAMTERTKVVYGETLSNPLLAVADIPQLANICHEYDAKLVIDNTFAPLIMSPLKLGADFVVHSLTKYINGMGDHLGGVVSGNERDIMGMLDVNSGAAMLLGPCMDALVSSAIRKNIATMPIRVQQHGRNGLALARGFENEGFRVVYPGLSSHPDHALFCSISNSGFGAGGVLTLDCRSREAADRLMQAWQNRKLGYLAVSLGYVHTLFSMPACSTSSEIPLSERERIGLSDGFVRISVGVEADTETLVGEMVSAAKEVLIASRI